MRPPGASGNRSAEATHSAIALAVFGDDRTTMTQLVGQCLLRLRGAGGKSGRRYAAPLVAAVDKKDRRLPSEAGPGRAGCHGDQWPRNRPGGGRRPTRNKERLSMLRTIIL